MLANLLAQTVGGHSGEEWFHFTKWDYATFAVILGIYLVLVFTDRVPSISSFQEFISSFNTPGGHVFVLGLFTAWSIKIAMQFFYHIMGLPNDTVSKEQAIITAGITFVTGTLVGSFMGALLKTMTGAEKPVVNNVAPKPPDLTVAGVATSPAAPPPKSADVPKP